uniref:Uncharacterized protein n=1 Tax=Panagrolaimus sp. PS1159 TaxID=55785 RepID=A0AC35FI05_9BILA
MMWLFKWLLLLTYFVLTTQDDDWIKEQKERHDKQWNENKSWNGWSSKTESEVEATATWIIVIAIVIPLVIIILIGVGVGLAIYCAMKNKRNGGGGAVISQPPPPPPPPPQPAGPGGFTLNANVVV